MHGRGGFFRHADSSTVTSSFDAPSSPALGVQPAVDRRRPVRMHGRARRRRGNIFGAGGLAVGLHCPGRRDEGRGSSRSHRGPIACRAMRAALFGHCGAPTVRIGGWGLWDLRETRRTPAPGMGDRMRACSSITAPRRRVTAVLRATTGARSTGPRRARTASAGSLPDLSIRGSSRTHKPHAATYDLYSGTSGVGSIRGTPSPESGRRRTPRGCSSPFTTGAWMRDRHPRCGSCLTRASNVEPIDRVIAALT